MSSDCKILMRLRKHTYNKHKSSDQYFELSRELNYPEDTTLFKTIANKIMWSDSVNKPDTTIFHMEEFRGSAVDSVLSKPFRKRWIISDVVARNKILYTYTMELYYNFNERIFIYNKHKSMKFDD